MNEIHCLTIGILLIFREHNWPWNKDHTVLEGGSDRVPGREEDQGSGKETQPVHRLSHQAPG